MVDDGDDGDNNDDDGDGDDDDDDDDDDDNRLHTLESVVGSLFSVCCFWGV